jgi:hypothetical protein
MDIQSLSSSAGSAPAESIGTPINEEAESSISSAANTIDDPYQGDSLSDRAAPQNVTSDRPERTSIFANKAFANDAASLIRRYPSQLLTAGLVLGFVGVCAFRSRD